MNNESALKFLSAARQSGLIAVDTETTGLKVRDGTDYCMGVSIAYRTSIGMFSCYLPFRHTERSLDRSFVSILKDTLAECDLIFFNRKFDLHSLFTLGIDLGNSRRRHFDSIILAHMINEEIPYSKDLNTLAGHYLDGESKHNKDQIDAWGKAWGWDNIPYDLIEPYANKDAELHYRLWEVLWPKWLEDYDSELWDWEQQFNDVLYRMEQRGVAVDLDFCRKKAEIGYGIMSDIEDALGFNPGSSKQLGKFLIEELNMPVLERSAKTNKPSFNKNVMEQYDQMLAANGSHDAQRILEYRGWQKAVTALYDPMQQVVSLDGRVRANFKQTGTKTGRLSCSEPNMQQLPRRSDRPWNGNARTAFSSGRSDHSLVSFDYSQLELRLAASYGNETLLLEEFSKEKSDPFQAIANQLGIPRQDAKNLSYAQLYEAGVDKVAYMLNRPVVVVDSLRKQFRTSIPGIMAASVAARNLAKERKFVRLWTGRRRHYPFFDSKHYTAFNSVLQGGGAEVVKRSMVNIANELENEECFMVLQVHDEIVFSIRTDKIDYYKPQIIKIMENHPQFPITLKVEEKVWA